MRARLISHARALFVEKGYADTSTPEIVRAANVTRGALYHHFADKTDLFRSVLEHEAQTVAAEIENKTMQPDSALDALMKGAEAYFDAMTIPGRIRLLLLEGPHYVWLPERQAEHPGADTFWSELSKESAADHDMGRYEQRLQSKVEEAIAVPFEDRHQYMSAPP